MPLLPMLALFSATDLFHLAQVTHKEDVVRQGKIGLGNGFIHPGSPLP